MMIKRDIFAGVIVLTLVMTLVGCTGSNDAGTQPNSLLTFGNSQENANPSPTPTPIPDPNALPPSSPGCLDSLKQAWTVAELQTPQSGVFSLAFSARPHDTNMDGVIAFSQNEGRALDDFAALVRFNSNGQMEALDGDQYRADQPINYAAGITYPFLLSMDVPNHQYSVKFDDKVVISKAKFRSNQQGITKIDHGGMVSQIGTFRLCDFQFVNPSCGNKIIESGETCDDGNQNSRDGCSGTCQIEANYTCQGEPSLCSYQNECSDQIDNDGDGFTDSSDFSCQQGGLHEDSYTAACQDGVDNDNDNLIDTLDSGCNSNQDNDETNTPSNKVTQIKHHKITWKFAEPVPAGQFANGDWWVVGPVKITDISPGTVYSAKEQVVSVMDVVGGTFKLTFAGQTTRAIPYNASEKDLELALESLNNITDVRVLRNGNSKDIFNWRVFFEKSATPTVLSMDKSSLTPKSGKAVRGGASMRHRNGSQVNPSPKLGNVQGFDNMTDYNRFDISLNVGLNISSTKPLVLQPHTSLVSTISVPEPRSRPQVGALEVLTILGTPAKPGDFRPPYAGKDKTIRFNESQLNFSLLKKLKPTSNTPSLASVEADFRGPWYDVLPHWMGKYVHPKDNMEIYGRNLASEVGRGTLMLNLDFTNDQKRPLLIRMVQLGIDLWGIVQDGGQRNWLEAGGHQQGRKLPILFAGVMLNDSAMKNVGFNKDIWFQHDRQMYYVTQADITRVGHPQSDLGKPMWGIHHTREPKHDKLWGKDPYQFCCTANSMHGQLLTTYIMGLTKLWNSPVTYDYHDRYLQKTDNQSGWTRSWDSWQLEMWNTYRKIY